MAKSHNGKIGQMIGDEMTELDSYIDENLFPKVYIKFLGKNTSSDSFLFLSLVLL